MTQRFAGYIHSIIGHVIMVSPNADPGEQYKCTLDDFESIMPTASANQPFVFHVKRDKIGVEHYRKWLGLAKIDNDRLENLEQGLLKLIRTLQKPAPAEPIMPRTAQSDEPFMSAEDMAASLMESRTA